MSVNRLYKVKTWTRPSCLWVSTRHFVNS